MTSKEDDDNTGCCQCPSYGPHRRGQSRTGFSSGRTVNKLCSSPSTGYPVTVPPVPLPIPPDPIVETVSDVDADTDVDPPAVATNVEYVSLNAVAFTNTSFAWREQSLSVFKCSTPS